MNQNLNEAPPLPPNMLPNIYGNSLARWAIDKDGERFYYGPNREPIPYEVAAMGDEQQARVALENFRSQEDQRQQEMSEAAQAEAEKEAEALAEAERRDLQELEDEIERRAQSRAADLIDAANKEPADAGPGTDQDEDDQDSDTESQPAPVKELAEIIDSCTTKTELEAELKDVQWQHIKKAVAKLGLPTGNKTQNIETLAGHLGLE